jgi:hypothetical protein
MMVPAALLARAGGWCQEHNIIACREISKARARCLSRRVRPIQSQAPEVRYSLYGCGGEAASYRYYFLPTSLA